MVMSSEGLKYYSSRCVIVFHEYSNKLSKVFKEHQADINFVLVGAFYGNNEMFLSNIHWRAAIVDAVDSNIRNLKHYLLKNSALDRAYFVLGAFSQTCSQSNISILHQTKELQSRDGEEWVQWRVGNTAMFASNSDAKQNKWRTESVRCVPAMEFLQQWAGILYNKKMAKRNKLRPHVLKINSHDANYEVVIFAPKDVALKTL